MAVRRVPYRICDRCGSDTAVQRVRIQLLDVGRTASLDLCEICMKPVTDILPPKRPRGQSQGQVVHSEATVRQARRTRRSSGPKSRQRETV